jgi:recombination protein RecA
MPSPPASLRSPTPLQRLRPRLDLQPCLPLFPMPADSSVTALGRTAVTTATTRTSATTITMAAPASPASRASAEPASPAATHGSAAKASASTTAATTASGTAASASAASGSPAATNGSAAIPATTAAVVEEVRAAVAAPATRAASTGPGPGSRPGRVSGTDPSASTPAAGLPSVPSSDEEPGDIAFATASSGLSAAFSTATSSTTMRNADSRSSDTRSGSAAADARAAAERDKALGQVLNQIERNFGKGSIVRLGDASRMRVETIPTGALTLDLALGGGYPKGRVVEVYGPESSGKTTLTLHAIAEVQRRGGVAAFVDAEHALDPVYAAALGVDIENLLVSQPDTGEMALEIVDQLVRSGAVDVVVVDSVAALTPRAEIEGEMGDLAVGSQARLMSQAMRKITGNIGKSGCTVIFLNQLRQKIGVTYGNPETTTGGNALKFYASVRLDIRRIQTLKRGTEEYGIRAKVKVAKNKVAPPFRIAEFDILFGRGISTLGCLLDMAEETGVVIRKGAWYSYEGDNIGQGRDNTIGWLEQNPAAREQIEQLTRRKLVEGSEVTANSMKPLAAAAKLAASSAAAEDGEDLEGEDAD